MNDVIVTDELLERLEFKIYRKLAAARATPMPTAFIVDTTEGRIRGKAGDYLCLDLDGNPYPHDRGLFEASYAQVDADTPEAIKVWRWADAPMPFRALSQHGGDEDWVALVPAGHDRPEWAFGGTHFGVCDVSEHPLPGGDTVLIGAHA